MRYSDFVRFTLASLAAHRLRTFLTALGIAVGIAAVILLTSIGEGLCNERRGKGTLQYRRRILPRDRGSHEVPVEISGTG